MLRTRLFVNLASAVCGAVMVSSPARGDVEDRIYDFNDAYYLANGVNPAKIGGRPSGVLPNSTVTPALHPWQRDVRLLRTSGAFNGSGGLQYFHVLGGGDVTLFTADAAGQRAKQLADSSAEIIFAKASASATDPFALGPARQPAMQDTRNGYFGNNPLGLWIHVFVSYTPSAAGTAEGRKVLADLGKKNGFDLDGTPMIRSLSDIDMLFSKGLVTKLVPPESSTRRYAICPVNADPTDGGIAIDQFLNFDRKADGTPLVPALVNSFESLRTTGRWSN